MDNVVLHIHLPLLFPGRVILRQLPSGSVILGQITTETLFLLDMLSKKTNWHNYLWWVPCERWSIVEYTGPIISSQLRTIHRALSSRELHLIVLYFYPLHQFKALLFLSSLPSFLKNTIILGHHSLNFMHTNFNLEVPLTKYPANHRWRNGLSNYQSRIAGKWKSWSSPHRFVVWQLCCGLLSCRVILTFITCISLKM